MELGTALAIIGLTLDVAKDLYAYYSVWKAQDEDIAEIRAALLWLTNLFAAVKATLDRRGLDESQKNMICGAIISCRETIDKLQKRLNKAKREGMPDTLLQKVQNQGRRALYPFQRATILRLLELIEELKDRMHVVIALLNLDTAAKSLRTLKELDLKVDGVAAMVDNMGVFIRDDAHRQYRQKVLDWLEPINQSEIHAASSRKHEPGTGNWFLKGEAFENWMRDPGSSLWLHGNLGCGKTILYSSIVNDLQGRKSETTSTYLASFYCLYRKGAQHELAPILRTLITQLCPYDSCPAPLSDLYELHNKKFPPGVANDVELKSTLLDMIAEVVQTQRSSKSDPSEDTYQFYILIDALDELPVGSHRLEILKFFADLAALHIPRLHIIATSRDESDIRFELSSWKEVPINKERVMDDVRLYVDIEMKRHYELSTFIQNHPETKNLIVRRLVDEGNGMFRWAALQLEELKALRPLRPRKVMKALKSLPKDLNETYERILAKVPDFNSEEALGVLRWVCFAVRPLFVEELGEICALDLGSQPEFDAAERYSPIGILDLLPGLVTINPPLPKLENPPYRTHTVTFSHFSVQEYLLRDRICDSPARKYSLEPEYSNLFIARSSIAYLFCCNNFQRHLDDYPLRKYAWDYWAWHTICNTGKLSSESCAKAEALFNSIAQQLFDNREPALKSVASRLFQGAQWQHLSASLERSLAMSLRVPFFYEEYDKGPDGSGFYTKLQTSFQMYEYGQLKTSSPTIRLIELFPSPMRWTEIRCRLFEVSLDDMPIFDGVSYLCGDFLDTAYIRCNGRLLQVPANLVKDLRNMRVKDGDRGTIIFVDAVCFNQENPLEQERKVSLMPRIFQQARQVAIGLGDSTPTDAIAIEFIQKSTSLYQMNWDGNSVHDMDAGLTDSIVKTAEVVGDSVLTLFQRPWWLRVWPVQELILPKKATLYYGDLPVTFDIIQKFFEMEAIIKNIMPHDSYMRLVSNKAWIGATRVSRLRAQYLEGRHPTLPELLWATQFHQSRDRSTKIYALIGLLCPHEQKDELITQDVTLGDEEYFTRVTLHIFKKHRNLDILSYASNHRWEAGKEEERVSFQVQVNPARLLVQGYCVGTIEAIHKTFKGNESGEDLRQLYHSIKDTGDKLYVPEGQSSAEAFWRTLHVDQWQNQRLSAVDATFEAMHYHDEHLSTTSSLDPHFQYCKGRQLVISSQGYLCLSPAESKIGDFITVLPGGKVPYILRGSSISKELTFIGECYVHGIMDGEIIAAASEGGEHPLDEFCLV